MWTLSFLALPRMVFQLFSEERTSCKRDVARRLQVKRTSKRTHQMGPGHALRFATVIPLLFVAPGCRTEPSADVHPGHTVQIGPMISHGPPDSRVSWPKAIIRLERTACLDACPQYRVSVYPDGRVEYEGFEFVGVCGKQVGWIGRDQFLRLVSAFQAANFLSAEFRGNSQVLRVSDLSTAITLVEVADLHRSIRHYGPELDSGALTSLENLVDSIANTPQWTRCHLPKCSCASLQQSE